MFFIMGITQGRKDYSLNQVFICDQCGSYGRYQVFMTYMCLSLFFIPCFKWNKKYYVQSTCCQTVYSLDPAIGRQIVRGENIQIVPEHLVRVNAGYQSSAKKCHCCGFETREDFLYCPKCGNKFTSDYRNVNK